MLAGVKATAARLRFAPALTPAARLARGNLWARGSSGRPPAGDSREQPYSSIELGYLRYLSHFDTMGSLESVNR